MTTQEKLLVLDAALCAAEGCISNPEMAKKALELSNWFSTYWDASLPDFGDYLDAQKIAVKKLADNPAVFGGE